MFDTLQDAWRAFTDIPYIHLYVTGVWIAYMIGLGGWIVLQKREPVATLSWLLGLAALPVVGLLVYQVFGPQKIKRHRLRRSRSRMPREEFNARGGDEAAELARLGAAATGLPPSTAQSVQLLIDGAAKYASLLEAIATAREHIHVEYYICQPDSTGNALLEALVERARAGVRVRLLLDAVGSAKATRRFFAPLLAAGGEFAWFHPARFGRIWTRTWVNMRTHRKIVVIDGRIGFTGGINITDDENDRLRDDAYRDLHLRIEGDAVRLLQVVFVEDWMYATKSRALLGELSRDLPARRPGPVSAQALPSGPDSSWESIHRMHVSAIHAARERVWLMTPYFVPTEAALMSLTSAALGGLDVRLMVPARSDSLLVTLAARSYFDDLLAAGVKVYQYGPRLLHTKALLVDDEFALIGSANFDNRSFRLNFELSMLFHDATIAAELAALFEHDLGHAPRVRDDRDRSLLRAKLPEALARLCAPLL
ncbi:MAG TPA: cardiolipin synthase [Luteimonas sp.]